MRAISGLSDADLVIVIGTSLTVHPFASLAERVDKSCPRVLINLDRVGDFGSRGDDVVLLGKCDDIVKELCKELHWEEELIKAWEETRDGIEEDANNEVDTESLDEEECLEQEIANLTSMMEGRLALDDVATEIRLKQDGDGSHDPSSPSFTGQPIEEEDDAPGAVSRDGKPTKLGFQDPKDDKEESAINQCQSQVGEIRETKDQEGGSSQSSDEILDGKL